MCTLYIKQVIKYTIYTFLSYSQIKSAPLVYKNSNWLHSDYEQNLCNLIVSSNHAHQTERNDLYVMF